MFFCLHGITNLTKIEGENKIILSTSDSTRGIISGIVVQTNISNNIVWGELIKNLFIFLILRRSTFKSLIKSLQFILEYSNL